MTVRLGSLCTFLGRVSNTLRTPSPTPEARPALLGRGQPLLPCPPPASGNPEPTSPSQLPLRLAELLGPRPSSPQGGPTAAGWAGQRGLPPRAPLQGKGWSQCCGQCVALQVGRAGLGAVGLTPLREPGELGNRAAQGSAPWSRDQAGAGRGALCGWGRPSSTEPLCGPGHSVQIISPVGGHLHCLVLTMDMCTHRVPRLENKHMQSQLCSHLPTPRRGVLLRSPLHAPQATVAPSSQPSTLTVIFVTFP